MSNQTDGIIWLASFPKSGNTWLRAFLHTLITGRRGPLSVKDIEGFCLHDSDLAPYEDYLGRSPHGMRYDEVARLRPAVQRFIVETLRSRVLVKTHSDTRDIDGGAALNADVTAGAIVVVRNPLDIVASHAEHYGVSLTQAARDITERRVASGRDRIPVFTGSWSSHTRHWIGGDLGFPRVIVRYEDLLDRPLTTFSAVAHFLGCTDRPRIRRALEQASFARLRASEREQGFAERSPKARRFFRQGCAGRWRDVLSPALAERVASHCAAPMRQLGYLDASRPAGRQPTAPHSPDADPAVVREQNANCVQVAADF